MDSRVGLLDELRIGSQIFVFRKVKAAATRIKRKQTKRRSTKLHQSNTKKYSCYFVWLGSCLFVDQLSCLQNRVKKTRSCVFVFAQKRGSEK